MHRKVISSVWKVKLSKRNNGSVIWGSKDGAKFFSVQPEQEEMGADEIWEIPFTQKMTQEKEEEKNATFLLWGLGSTKTSCPERM